MQDTEPYFETLNPLTACHQGTGSALNSVKAKPTRRGRGAGAENKVAAKTVEA